MSGAQLSSKEGRTARDVSSLRPNGRVPLAAVQRQPRPLAATAADGARHGALGAAERFASMLAALDRNARHERRTLPRAEERAALHAAFWRELIPALASAESRLDPAAVAELRAEVQTLVNVWLLRSRYWNRSWVKPHGYPGDFRVLEWMYDLEAEDCADPTQPAIINLLDGLYRSVHSVQAVWHRRAWFAAMIAARLDASRAQRPVRVLDIACGGSRYLRDLVGRHPAALEATFLDQDPAALAFVEAWLPMQARGASRLICAPVRRDHELNPASPGGARARFDVVISTGLFDYLSEEHARGLLEHMTASARPGGTVAICNFCPDDRSRIVKDWISDWRLIYRTRTELKQLFPQGIEPTVSKSADGGLLYARADV